MSRASSQERSGSELVFGVLKTLMIGYRFWGVASGFELAQLSRFLRTTETRLDLALTYLAAEGLVSLDKSAGTVRLSDQGARHLLAELREVGG